MPEGVFAPPLNRVKKKTKKNYMVLKHWILPKDYFNPIQGGGAKMPAGTFFVKFLKE